MSATDNFFTKKCEWGLHSIGNQSRLEISKEDLPKIRRTDDLSLFVDKQQAKFLTRNPKAQRLHREINGI